MNSWWCERFQFKDMKCHMSTAQLLMQGRAFTTRVRLDFWLVVFCLGTTCVMCKHQPHHPTHTSYVPRSRVGRVNMVPTRRSRASFVIYAHSDFFERTVNISCRLYLERSQKVRQKPKDVFPCCLLARLFGRQISLQAYYNHHPVCPFPFIMV